VGSIGILVELAELPDPTAPTYDAAKKKWLKPELVRVNHLGNCLLCHAASKSLKDALRSPIPVPGRELPVVYYQGSKSPSVRADITYMRQDFSVSQHVEHANPWPEEQRFDYILRQRELPEKEGAALAAAARGKDYPQRLSVLFALIKLREMVGYDRGSDLPVIESGEELPVRR
jgi:hypothetical protein